MPIVAILPYQSYLWPRNKPSRSSLFLVCLMKFIIFTILVILPFASGAQGKSVHFIEGIEINGQAKIVIPAAPAPVHSPVFWTSNLAEIETLSPLQFKYAMIMDREVESLDNLSLYSFIDDWMSTPYRMGGNTKSGIDCSAFARTLMQNVYGTPLPRTSRAQYEESVRLSMGELEEGDLVFFNTGGAPISHVGIYLGNNYFVHSSCGKGVTISSLDDPYYHKHYRGAGRNTNKHLSVSSSSR